MGANPAYSEEIPRVRVRSLNSSIIPGMTMEEEEDAVAKPPFRVGCVVPKLACRVRISSNGAVANVAKSRAVDPATSGMCAGMLASSAAAAAAALSTNNCCSVVLLLLAARLLA